MQWTHKELGMPYNHQIFLSGTFKKVYGVLPSEV